MAAEPGDLSGPGAAEGVNWLPTHGRPLQAARGTGEGARPQTGRGLSDARRNAGKFQ